MARWSVELLRSSVGRKAVMAITGLGLVGFLVEHLHGNLKLTPLAGNHDGAFDDYVGFLNSFGSLLYLAEAVLFVLFGSHVYLAVRLARENRAARSRNHVIRNDRGAKTVSSTTMLATGVLLLVFLVKHLVDFRFCAAFHESPASTVADKLADPAHAIVYIGAAVLVGVHLRHGFWSAFQTLGLSHPRWTPVLRLVGVLLSAVLAVGFAGITVYLFLVPD